MHVLGNFLQMLLSVVQKQTNLTYGSLLFMTACLYEVKMQRVGFVDWDQCVHTTACTDR